MGAVDTKDFEYDIDSVMHFGPTATMKPNLPRGTHVTEVIGVDGRIDNYLTENVMGKGIRFVAVCDKTLS